jgi:hypothetical protein
VNTARLACTATMPDIVRIETTRRRLAPLSVDAEPRFPRASRLRHCLARVVPVGPTSVRLPRLRLS